MGGGSDQHKIAWVGWDTVCLSKDKGGLGIKDINNFNIALLGKWRWHLMQQKGELWARVVDSKYGGWRGLNEVDRVGSESVWWRDLKRALIHSQQGQLIQNGLKWKVGSGDKIKFWEDRWICGEESLQQQQLIQQMGSHKDNGWEWNFTWRRTLFENEIDLAVSFLNEVQHKAIQQQEIDVPSRVTVFTWRLVRDRLPTRQNLQRRQVSILEMSCPLCRNADEDAAHLFLHCSRIQPIWWESMSWLNLKGAAPLTPKQHFLQHMDVQAHGVRINRWQCWWLALTWSIWRHRNNIVFSNETFNANKLFDDAIFNLWTWLRNFEKGFTIHFNQWSSNIRQVFSLTIQIDPSTRRLQLVDATGGIDILIPDLPLTWNPNEIYEVTDFDVVVDSIGELVDQIELLGSESLSCRTIFNCTKAEGELSTSIFVYCHWKNAKCKNIPLYSCINSKNETETLEPGSYHLLRVSHKFPLQEKYSNKAVSCKSSTFVEAILFPFILLLSGKSRIAHPCNASWDKTKELSKYCISVNNEDKVSNKRQKLIKESVSSSKDEFHTSICELNACSNSSRKPEENKKCVNLRSSHDVSCLVTFRRHENENVVCTAILRSISPMKETSYNSKPSSRKILLEFSSDRFLKYQLLQIGDYYIIDHNRKDCFSSTKDANFGSSGSAKLLVDSGKHIWSLSFIYDENLSDYLSEYTSEKDSLSSTIDEVLPKDKKILPRSNGEPSGVCSDVCLYLPISLADVLEDNIMESKDSQRLHFAISKDSANLSLGTAAVVARPKSCFGTQRSSSLFPEGNLMSLEGNVVDIHEICSGFNNSCSNGANLDALQLKGLIGTRSSFCIHVSVHHHIVNIFGSVNKHAFPTGFGPGVTAAFHRILNAGAQNKYMLLPVSFIVIKSIKVCDKQCSDRSSFLNPTKDSDNASQGSISCLISQLPQSLSHKQIVLRCRVVAVLVLVIERKTTHFIAETKVNAKGTLLDIPLACFLLVFGKVAGKALKGLWKETKHDGVVARLWVRLWVSPTAAKQAKWYEKQPDKDGSSSCCCWASAERAATLLRLHEDFATCSHLGRILKNHHRITVKNNGLYIDSPYQDLLVSVTSGNALCSSDENLLKLIIFNACVGGIWNVVASGMDAEEIRELEKEYLTEMVNVQNMQNIWTKEVSYPRTLAEARNMIQELLIS
ncbi:CST complex subunit CTC1 [Glycine soja]|uniref:CST complex subunit CTC1 n=1 Tax=Glycine soja TaxID=3848 RepID=A0A445JJA7_GLYSO|nr:CST complex subunit CTC1 [Glycine soja]